MKSLLNQVLRIIESQQNGFHFGITLADFYGRVDSGDTRHRDVQQNYIRMQLPGQPDGVLTVFRLSANALSGKFRQQTFDSVQHERMVVDNKHTGNDFLL